MRANFLSVPNKAYNTTLQLLLAGGGIQSALFCWVNTDGHCEAIASEGISEKAIGACENYCNQALQQHQAGNSPVDTPIEHYTLLAVEWVHNEQQNEMGVLLLADTQITTLNSLQQQLLSLAQQQLATLLTLQPISAQLATTAPISLTTFTNSSHHSKVIVSADYTIIKFNQVAFEQTKRLFGRGLQEGQHILTQMIPDIQEAFLTHFKEALGGNEVLSERTLPFDHLPIVWQIHYFPIKDADGKVIAVAITLSDISELKQTQLALQQHQAILGKAQQIGQIGYFYTDIPSDNWNSSAVFDQILGLDRKSVV